MSLLKRVREKREPVVDAPQVHPLVAHAARRDVRNAYLYGLVFAAIANDDSILCDEEKYLFAVCQQLGFPEGELVHAVRLIQNLPDEDKIDLLRDCSAHLGGKTFAERFCEEFTTIWKMGNGDDDELREFIEIISELSEITADAVNETLRVFDAKLFSNSGLGGYDDAIEERDDNAPIEGDDQFGDTGRFPFSRASFVKDDSKGFGDDLEDRE